jgi:hypothetical protein
MSSVHRRGVTEPLRQNYSENYDPESGWKRDWHWRGLSIDRMREYAAQYQRLGCATSLSLQRDIAELEVRDTTGEITIDRWEVDAEQVNKSSLVNPLHFQGSGPIPAANLEIIARALRDGSTLEEARSRLEDDTGDIYGDVTNARALRLFARMLKGEVDFETDVYTLVHTTNVGNRYGQNVADLNKGLLYTTAQLLSETQSSYYWIYPLPGRLAYKIQNLANDAAFNFPAPDYYAWRWLKSASTERSAANNRVDISTIYKFDLYSLDEFASA